MKVSKGIKIYNGDCLDIISRLVSRGVKVDHILCDLPYNITKLSWDSMIPFDRLWEQYKAITKPNSNILLFCSGLFTYEVIKSNLRNFKYKLVWKKNVPTGMSSAKYRPMKYYEEICVFNFGHNSVYNPIMKPREGVGKSCYNYNHYCGSSNHLSLNKQPKLYNPDWVQPSDILEFNVVPNRNGKLHPTQKPLDLCEYLIKTYSNEGDIILDNCMGSGTTGVSCIHTNRKFIGIELNSEYYHISKIRLIDESKQSIQK